MRRRAKPAKAKVEQADAESEVPMRLIRLVVVLALSLILAPLVAEAQQAGKVWRIGFLGVANATTEGER
jgi:hypothetical protein